MKSAKLNINIDTAILKGTHFNSICAKGYFFKYLKPAKVYFGCDNMAQFDFGQNWPILTKTDIFGEISQFGSLKGELPDKMIYLKTA